MSFVERRELEINPEGGGSITFERADSVVQISRTIYYSNFDGEETPIELDTADRLKLMELLNMGEYRLLSEAERR